MKHEIVAYPTAKGKWNTACRRGPFLEIVGGTVQGHHDKRGAVRGLNALSAVLGGKTIKTSDVRWMTRDEYLAERSLVNRIKRKAARSRAKK